MNSLKEKVLAGLQITSNEIAVAFDKRYEAEINDIATELGKSYDTLFSIINKEDQSTVSDQDFQSATLFWTGLNTILSAVDLFRRGYSKEPQMLLRDALETFAAAYDVHKDINKFKQLTENPKDFDSTKSIKVVKEIHPILGNFYGILSGSFAHVSTMHTVPHLSDTPLAIGGLFDPKKQHTIVLGLTTFILTVDVLNSVLEFSLIKYIDEPKFWKKINNNTYEFTLNRKRIDAFLKNMKDVLETKNIDW